MVASEMLKKQKVTITLVSQGYESTKGRQDYKTGTGMTYRGRSVLMDIEKTKDNFDKDRRLKCFNCNTYGQMAKDCRKPKKE